MLFNMLRELLDKINNNILLFYTYSEFCQLVRCYYHLNFTKPSRLLSYEKRKFSSRYLQQQINI